MTNELLLEIHDDSRIVIVDNNSPNGSYELLVNYFSGNPLVGIVKADVNGGFEKGNNLGLRYLAKYYPEYIVNNDVHFSLKTIDSLCDVHEKFETPAIISSVQSLQVECLSANRS